MKVLHVNSLYPPHVGGGAEVVLAGTVRGFRARGQDAVVLTTHGGSGVQRDEVDGVPVYRMGHQNLYWHFPPREHSASARTLWHAMDSYNLFAGRQAGALIDEIEPDLIVCHNLAGLSVSVWAQAERRRVPVVQVLHDYYTLCPKSAMFRDGKPCAAPCGGCGVFRLPHRNASKAVAAVVGVSRAILDTHLAQGMFAKARVRAVVHNARKLPAPAERETTAAFTFGFIGALTEVKGVDLLARAFLNVARASLRPMRLLIAGSGKPEEVDRLRRTYDSPQISFVGHVDPVAFYRQLDVSVVPSLWHEPLGMVAFESIGAGVPVIGARRGGIPEIVQHELNGLLFEPAEAGGLERCLQRVLDDAALLQSMRAAGRESVAHLLDPDRMLDEYDAVFQRVRAATPAIGLTPVAMDVDPHRP
jgi:glycosyltransferase involved in cell wall biosynthesis